MSLIKSLGPIGVLLFAACGGSSPSTTPREPTPVAAPADPSCPVTVAGTSVSVEDTDTGAALVFVTTSDVAELRKRVTTMAQMHNEHHAAMGPLPDGTGADAGHAGHEEHAGHAGHAGHGDGAHAGHGMSQHAGHAGGMIGVHSKAAASELEGGAKIAFIASGADVAKLQSELRMHAQHFAAGTCEMGKH